MSKRDEGVCMHEVFPVVAGILLGLVAMRLASRSLRTVVLVVGSVLLGFAATVLSGEALISWAFVLIDIPLVFGSALAAIGVAALWERRATATLRH